MNPAMSIRKIATSPYRLFALHELPQAHSDITMARAVEIIEQLSPEERTELAKYVHSNDPVQQAFVLFGLRANDLAGQEYQQGEWIAGHEKVIRELESREYGRGKLWYDELRDRKQRLATNQRERHQIQLVRAMLEGDFHIHGFNFVTHSVPHKGMTLQMGGDVTGWDGASWAARAHGWKGSGLQPSVSPFDFFVPGMGAFAAGSGAVRSQVALYHYTRRAGGFTGDLVESGAAGRIWATKLAPDGFWESSTSIKAAALRLLRTGSAKPFTDSMRIPDALADQFSRPLGLALRMWKRGTGQFHSGPVVALDRSRNSLIPLFTMENLLAKNGRPLLRYFGNHVFDYGSDAVIAGFAIATVVNWRKVWQDE
jgi:hypothetical protein